MNRDLCGISSVTTDIEHLKGLNKEQREAAIHLDGPLLIIISFSSTRTALSTGGRAKSNVLCAAFGL